MGNWVSLDVTANSQSAEFTAGQTKRDDMTISSYTSDTTGKPKAVVHSHGWGYAHVSTYNNKMVMRLRM